MLSESALLTNDGVDTTTLIGKRVWYQPYGEGSLSSFVVNGIDITFPQGSGSPDVRLYEDDGDLFIKVGDVRARPASWAESVYLEKAAKLTEEALLNGVALRFEIVEATPVG